MIVAYYASCRLRVCLSRGCFVCLRCVIAPPAPCDLGGESVTADRSYLRIVFSSMERFDLVQKAGQEDAGLFEDDFDLALPTPPP